MINRKFGRKADHRKALLRNLATSLIVYGKIETTEMKAMDLRSVVDELITVAKKIVILFFSAQLVGPKLRFISRSKLSDIDLGQLVYLMLTGLPVATWLYPATITLSPAFSPRSMVLLSW